MITPPFGIHDRSYLNNAAGKSMGAHFFSSLIVDSNRNYKTGA